MTTYRGRRKHDRNFKIEAVHLVTEGGRRVAEVARDLGIHENLIYKWRQELMQDEKTAFPGAGNLKPADEELRRLKRQGDLGRTRVDAFKKILSEKKALLLRLDDKRYCPPSMGEGRGEGEYISLLSGAGDAMAKD